MPHIIADSGINCKFEVTTNQFTMTILQQITEVSKPHVLLPIKGCEDYYVNENGDIFSSKREPAIKMKPKLNKGYNVFYVCSQSKHTTLKVHRIVAQHFIPNPENYPQVNHKDGNKQNNHISNLEWCDHGQNMKHSWALGLTVMTTKRLNGVSKGWYMSKKGFGAKKVIDSASGKIYDSVGEAAEFLGLTCATLSRYMGGKRKNMTTFKYLQKAL